MAGFNSLGRNGYFGRRLNFIKMEYRYTLFIVGVLSLLLSCKDNTKNEITYEDRLHFQAVNTIKESIPGTLLNESSYEAIEFSDLRPVYEDAVMLEKEIEICDYLIEWFNDIVDSNYKMGLSIDDKVNISTVKYPRSNMANHYYRYLDKLGYFSVDDFVLSDLGYKSFYENDNLHSQTIYADDSGWICRYAQVFEPIIGKIFLSNLPGYHTKVSDYLQNIARLLSKKSEIQKKIASGEKTLLGYDVWHKYNASNEYGGVVTYSETFHFNTSCDAYWTVDYSDGDVVIYKAKTRYIIGQ